MKVPPPHSPKIILVGNGPSVAKEQWGQIIDSADEVFRFNDYEIKAALTGTKTTCVVRNHQQPRTLVPDGATELRVVPPGVEVFADLPHIPRQVEGINWPSSGLCLLAYFVRANVKVSVIGLDAYEGARRYWEYDKPHNHDPVAEGKWLEDHYNAGKFKMLEDLRSEQ